MNAHTRSKAPARVLRQPLLLRKFLQTLDREKRHVLAEFSQVGGLMALLMKPRNRQKWSREDKLELMAHLRRFSALSPYLAVLLLPGGFVMLPVLAWWLDRRRGRRSGQAAAAR